MSDWLYSQSESGIFIVGLLGSVGLMYLMSFAVRRLANVNETSDHEKEFLIAIQSGLVALSAIVLSFSLVLVITNFERVDANVASEASRINDVDRLLHQYGDPALKSIRVQLKNYTQSILSDEWPKLKTKEEGAETANLFLPISDAIGKINPLTMREAAIYAEILKKLNEVMELRESRIESSHIGLHRIYWIVNFAILAGVLFMSAVALLLNRWLTAIGITLELAALVGLMTIVFLCDQPFKGSVSVKPDPFSDVLKIIEARQK
jgi:hypothetical protein